MGAIQFRILGPLSVEYSGSPVAVTGARLRSLLALLLLHRGEPLSAERLVVELWGEGQPREATKRAQMAVSRLRKALGPEIGSRIETNGAGQYRLAVAPEELDLCHFEQLLAQGRAEFGAGDPERAAVTLSSALHLWRGPPLTDLAYEAFAQAEIARLQQLRLDALEERVEADLALGRHTALVPEIESLVATNPFRERLHGQLMLSLYRSGRQADALDAYRRARTQLADELGLAPGPALRRLEQEVLEHASALDAPAQPAQTSADPPPSSSLIGREAPLRELSQRLADPAVRLITLCGPAGIGKTRLALAVADAVRDRYPDGVHLVPLAGVRRADQVAEQVAKRIGLVDKRGDDATLGLLGFLADREALLVLDNFEHVLGAASLVGEVLAACPRMNVLTTSRAALRLAAERRWTVAPLSLPDESEPLTRSAIEAAGATALFLARTRALDAEIPDGPEEIRAASEICRFLDGVPLAIELAAARIPVLGVRELAARLDSALAALGPGLRDAPPRQQTLRATLDWSYDLLTTEERRVLAGLTVFSGGCTVEAAQDVLDTDLDTLQSLAESSLLRRRPGTDGVTRLVMLEVVRQYAREQVGNEETWERLCVAHNDYYLALVERARTELHGREQLLWFRRLDDEAGNLRSALQWASDDAARAPDAVRLLSASVYWWDRVAPSEGRRQLEHALQSGGMSLPDLVRAAGNLAFSMLVASSGDSEQGLRVAIQALDAAERAGDPELLTRCLIQRAFLENMELGPDVALVTSERALAIAPDTWTMAITLFARANALAAKDSVAAARPLVEEAIELLREHGDLRHVAAIQSDQAYMAVLEEDFATAKDLIDGVVAISRQTKDPTNLAVALGNQGLVALGRREDRAAAAALRECLALCDAHGYFAPASEALTGLAVLAIREGAHDVAAKLTGAASAMRAGHLTPVEEQFQRVLDQARDQVGADRWKRRYASGARLERHEAVVYGLRPWTTTEGTRHGRAAFPTAHQPVGRI